VLNKIYSDVFVSKFDSDGGLVYSTYIGGDIRDVGLDIAVDEEGNAYITGVTQSYNFPLKKPFQKNIGQGSGPYDAVQDVFITKLNAQGNGLIYSTYLGGADWEQGGGIAVDSHGCAYITGETYSPDFPLRNPFQDMINNTNAYDIFVVKLDKTGESLIYSTFIGGVDYDYGWAIEVDLLGNAYIIGSTSSRDFPVENPYQGNLTIGEYSEVDSFVTKLNTTGNGLNYSTFIGGSDHEKGASLAIDSTGCVYITGTTHSSDFPTKNPFQTNQGYSDVYLTKFSENGDSLIYSTYLGGEGIDLVSDIAVDSLGNVYVTGGTSSDNFPTKDSFQEDPDEGYGDIFITKVNTTGNGLIFSTYLGGDDSEGANGIAVDFNGFIYITGTTKSTNFPTKNPLQANQGNEDDDDVDAFVMKLNVTGNGIVYSTYLHGEFITSETHTISEKTPSWTLLLVLVSFVTVGKPLVNLYRRGNHKK
jgi:hypothetical protein